MTPNIGPMLDPLNIPGNMARQKTGVRGQASEDRRTAPPPTESLTPIPELENSLSQHRPSRQTIWWLYRSDIY